MYLDRNGDFEGDLKPEQKKARVTLLKNSTMNEQTLLDEAKEFIWDWKSFKASVKVTQCDALGREHSNKDDTDQNDDIEIASLKVVNVPYRYDLIQEGIDPSINGLSLDYVDK